MLISQRKKERKKKEKKKKKKECGADWAIEPSQGSPAMKMILAA